TPHFSGGDGELDVIREELNLKKIDLTKNPEAIAEKSVVVNACVAGKKFGAKIQKIIAAAKNGEFEIVDNGVKILDEILSGEEITLGFRGKSGTAVESDGGIVVALDTKITPELKLEGKARDLVRVIQDLRKQADYDVSDRIQVQTSSNSEVITTHQDYIQNETLANEIVEGIDKPDAETEFNGTKFGVKKITK
ncbi:MAG: DUF5915 domain-containing protein, partial [Patescibacteria group bacterium]